MIQRLGLKMDKVKKQVLMTKIYMGAADLVIYTVIRMVRKDRSGRRTGRGEGGRE